ncbi:MAG: zeta toxin family protein [Prevotellaceae bacterium]|nr:zeta toxin family protein [Prevotellaceae bacterium]
MATIKRLRIFAGPNGSGKSTITQIVSKHVNLGHYVNADEIKKYLTQHRYLDLADYGVGLDGDKFATAFRGSTLSSRIKDIDCTLAHISFSKTKLLLDDTYDIEDYFVSFITSYIWAELLESANKFTVETVMSHPSKLEFMRIAKERGFKVYLYFVSLADPELNKHRVRTRIMQGGHPVAEDKIVTRYNRTMENLYDALKLADNAYMFDNSASVPNMFATKEKGTLTIQNDSIPKWFTTHVLDKTLQ